ncbi:hypothetical protein OY671_012074, partial [Metschnikowia pulcherrima]
VGVFIAVIRWLKKRCLALSKAERAADLACALSVPSSLSAIFADFSQLSNPERDRRKGLGLGLAIARRLADSIGARITLSSKPGQGSVFGLELPASVATSPLETQPQPAAVPAFRRSGGRVSISEDDEAVRQGLCASLADAG